MRTMKKGVITPALLVITGVFLVVIYGLLMLLTTQLNFSHRQVASEEALNIAEAGINYYRWHLAHDPDDYQDGTAQTGPYVHELSDPEGGVAGEYSLEITPPTGGSSIVTIRSTGRSVSYPSIDRTIVAQYGRPSLAKYAFLNNASTWYGAGIVVNGDIHSNNGIRMDGTNTGRVMSAKETYMCGSETGCHPPTERPGVWGSGGDQALWLFPVPPIDFDSVSFDFNQMRISAQEEGLYLESSTKSGYHITFDSDGSFSVYKVRSTNFYDGYSVPGEGLGEEGRGGCRHRNQLIDSEDFVGNYLVSEKPIIFAEDHLWVEGTVKGRVTVVAAGFPITSQTLNIWIRNNLTYAAYDGTNSLGLIAQNDIYFVRDLPEDFKVDGALMAQKGRVLRHGYFTWCGGTTNAIKNSLTINGALSSYGKSYWNFGIPLESGFINRNINYDASLLYSPPPYFPTTDVYEFISWKEE